MIESVDYLVDKNFGKLLCDLGVKIFEIVIGISIFVIDLIEYLFKNKLEYKYQNNIFCNEVVILFYYIGNFNIEYIYQQKIGSYEQFNNICFVDILEYIFFEGKQLYLFVMIVKNIESVKW